MWHENILSAIEFIGAQGYPAIEIWAEHVWRDDEDLRRVAKAVSAHGMQVSIHAPAGALNLADPDEEARRRALRETMRAIRLAADIGSKVVAVHPGRLGGSREVTWAMTVDALWDLSHHAERYGVIIALENMEKRNGEIFLTPGDLKDLIRTVGSDALGITLDVAHLCTVSDEPMELAQDFTDIDHVHLSDFSTESTHVPLGEGRLNIPAWVDVLDKRCNGLMILEGHMRGREREVIRANKLFVDRMISLRAGGGFT